MPIFWQVEVAHYQKGPVDIGSQTAFYISVGFIFGKDVVCQNL